jgi:dienelactone hydrolase
MKTYTTLLIASAFSMVLASCGNQAADNATQKPALDTVKTTPSIKTAEVMYPSNGKQSIGFIAFDQNLKGKLPIVVIIPEWWGLVDYVKSRARQLAELGYFAIAADVFGDGKTASTPAEAMAFTKPYYANPELSLPAVEAAAAKAATFSMADSNRVAVIGYCFGGFVVLNAAKLGAPFKAFVSFHGGLGGVQPKKGEIKGDILVCQGAADQFVPDAERAAFKKSMDSVAAKYTFIQYEGAMHAFSNPAATELGKKFNLPIAYNASADSASWKDMQGFFLTALK